MSQIANSGRISIEALQAAIITLTKLERRWRKSRKQRALYRYLIGVFDLYARWKRIGSAHRPAMRVARFAGLCVKHGHHPIRTIIDVTSSSNRKSKSRWTQALRFAWRERSQWKDLERCLRANGGIAGCASRWADQNVWKQTPPGYVRVGGEGFPKVPFFVGVEMLDKYGQYR